MITIRGERSGLPGRSAHCLLGGAGNNDNIELKNLILKNLRYLAAVPLSISVVVLAAHRGITIPNMPAALLLAVAYSAYGGGLLIGLIAAAVHVLYSAIFFSKSGQLFHYDTDNLVRALVIVVVAPAMATMLGILRLRADRSLRQLKVAEQDLLRLNSELEKRIEERTAELGKMARYDSLTGIANRAVLHKKLEDASVRLRVHRKPFTVLMLDLDEFKYINDTVGHGAGDQLLKELAHRLQSSLDETETLGRLGGDEFAIIQTAETNQRERAIALARRVLDIVAKPFDLDGHNVTIATSIGMALAPENGFDPGELLKKADLALYRVKAEGRNNFTFFDDEMSKDAIARHRLLNDLRGALLGNEFELYYQPLIDGKTVQPCGAEALVRWRHPIEGLIPPDRFIWLAEEAGLMEHLGKWILEQACADAATWPENIKVAVNLSAAQFRTGKLIDIVSSALARSALAPGRLELEITESVLLQDKESYAVVIQQLKDLGISVVLDDFGTGYSSLSYLTKFPFDKIKIDKSFTQGLLERTECAAVVAAVLTLARALDIAVTAEGIETKEQFEILRAAGVGRFQGFLFGQPVPLAELDFSACERKVGAGQAA